MLFFSLYKTFPMVFKMPCFYKLRRNNDFTLSTITTISASSFANSTTWPLEFCKHGVGKALSIYNYIIYISDVQLDNDLTNIISYT